MHCKICSRTASSENGYCELHAKAYENVIEKYEHWKMATGISWKEYLSEIAKNLLTGELAKEVVEHLKQNGEK